MITRVTELKDAQIVRMIRNEIRGNMTRHTAHITPKQQKEWLESLTPDTQLYLLTELDAPIGYSLIRYENGQAWGTLGVLPEFHNQGYGTILYTHMCNQVKELWIEIFGDNNPSLVAALKAGFEIDSVRDSLVLLKHNNNGFTPSLPKRLIQEQ